MPTLKVKQLEWYMKTSIHRDDYGYVTIRPRIGRDGYYCQDCEVWFEYSGLAFMVTGEFARENFCYELTVNDEAILPSREVDAMRTVLKTSRDASIKKVIRARLTMHEHALQLRSVRRFARLSRIKIFGR
jgi:hypothetical protein